MILNENLYNLFCKQAEKVKVDLLCLGLGYTVAVTSDGGIGIAYTYFADKKSCMVLNEAIDYEGRPANALLEKIKSESPIQRSMALALVNALNYQQALQYPEDENNEIMFEQFKITKGTKVAMVGYFGPLIKRFEQREAVLDILDQSRGLGRKSDFYKKLSNAVGFEKYHNIFTNMFNHSQLHANIINGLFLTPGVFVGYPFWATTVVFQMDMLVNHGDAVTPLEQILGGRGYQAHVAFKVDC